MNLALIGETAPSTQDSGQVCGTQSNPGEFSLALVAVLDLLKPPASDSIPIINSSGGQQANSGDSCNSCLDPVSFIDETTQESGQVSGTQAGTGESCLALAAALPLLRPPASGSAPVKNMVNGPDGENINSSLLSEALKDGIISSEKGNFLAEPAVVKEGVPGTGKNAAPAEGGMEGVPALAAQKESTAVKTALVRETSPDPGNSGMAVIQGKSGNASAVNEPANSIGTDLSNNVPASTLTIVKNAPFQANEKGSLAMEEGAGSGQKGIYSVSPKVENMMTDPNGKVEVKTDSKGLNSSPESNPNTTPLNTAAPAAAFIESRVSLPDLKENLVQQIQHFFDTYKGKPLTKVQLKLEPEHLGQLTIKLAFNKGELNAQFYTENSYVKDILESSIQQLRETLSQQDMKLNQAFVFVGDHGSGGTGSQLESGENSQTAFPPGGYSERAFQEVEGGSAGFDPSGGSYPLVDYLV